ncbi:cache domain-containing protein [Pseudodesulfovibrio sp. zrk46]|uniref:cache domain-containing protein n=1 Tax=Pseudodesulfovibrio sp. zrk46 TaxID=2725288 RepID=UPI00144A294E|nr:cache domain-containing protein [Pseudodesulfovibrio sp. zrk46]QJB56844.1 PAS domain-containing protein [Pseudodesulfovibrio sp. zrk46]
MYRVSSIGKLSLVRMVVVSWLSILLVGGFWASWVYLDFQEESDQLRSDYFAERKTLVLQEVQKAFALVDQIRHEEMTDLVEGVRSRAERVSGLIDALSRDGLPPSSISRAVMNMARSGSAHRGDLLVELADNGKTLLLLDYYPKGLDIDYLMKSLVGLHFGERRVVISMDDGTVFTFMLTVRQSESPAMRIVSGACMEIAEMEVRQRVVTELEEITYGEEGYLFGGTWSGVSMIGPAKGKKLWNVTDSNGVLIVQELVAAAKRGGGYVSYVMPRFNGKRQSPKISFVMPILDWKWYIGAGVYVDDVEVIIDQNRMLLKDKMISRGGIVFVVLLLLSILAYAASIRFAHNLQDTIRSFTDVWNRASSTGDFVNPEELRYSEFKALAEAANQMVADRRAAEVLLADRVAQFKTLAANLPGVVYQCTMDGERDVTFISDSVFSLTGYPASDFMERKRSFLSLIHADDVSWVNEVLWADAKHGRPYSLEYRLMCEDGGTRWVYDRGQARTGKNSGELTLDGVIIDVTERRKAEQDRYAHIHFLETMERVDRDIRRRGNLDTMLHEVMETVRKAFDVERSWLSTPCDPKTTHVRIMVETTGADDDVRSMDGETVAVNDDMRSVFAAALSSTGPVGFSPEGEHPVPPTAVEKFNVKSMMVVPLYPRIGDPWLMGVQQISKSREWSDDDFRLFKEVGRRISDALSNQLMNRELEESEEWFRTVTEQSSLGICVVQDYEVKFANQAYCDIFETSIEDMMALPPKGFMRFVHPDDQAMLMEQAHKKQTGARDAIETYTWRAITTTGKIKWVEIHSKTVNMAGLPADLICLLDITEMRRYRNELEQLVDERTAVLERQATELQEANARLFRLDDIKSSFLTMVSYDLQSPHDLEREDLSTLINEFTAYSGILAGTMEWHDRRIDAGDLITGAVDASRYLLDGKAGIDIALELPDYLPDLRVDEAMVKQLLKTLLDNAIRSMEAGVVTVSVESPDKREVRITVSDTGHGIPASALEDIFEPFHQLPQESDSAFRGSGLGLAMAKAIITRYGGSITVESTLGSGSSFVVSFPGIK